MPFGCFGKRKKQDRADKPNDKAGGQDGETVKNNATSDGGAGKTAEDSNTEVNEVIAVARAHSLHASAPNSVEHRHTTIGIQKSATLARYDFLRKSDFTNTADRWTALKQQYLAQHAGQNGSAGSGGDNKAQLKRTAMSLPRQFAPPNSANSIVRFSQWFYERQTMEADARREFHEREEKTRKLLDGVERQDSIPEVPASRADAANNGSQQLPEVDERPEVKDADEADNSSPAIEISDQHGEDSKAAESGEPEEIDEKRTTDEEADEINEAERKQQDVKADDKMKQLTEQPTADDQDDATSDAADQTAKPLTDDGPAVEANTQETMESHE